ncbi:MAG: acyl-CoA thioesterase [Dysgonamonadaceae bacterium]|jgi:acyl-CoA thioester hydrolase|nr:acyl-CoA thioesterase [Dysgonamonadaceae bacterium]
MDKKVFSIEMRVRDYECDVQGVVNNANYLHYFENTRHEFMISLGIPFFKEVHTKGITPVLARADLHYKTSLVGADDFISSLTVERKGVKIIFHQEIHRKSDNALCCKGTIEVAVLEHGRLSRGDYFDEFLKEYL